ncbi:MULTISPECIES: CU044_2847 family protein [Thermoleptolyngbya]|uniref:CU044_2847 family protein n=1 Tax=Thermoleptolyngbya TaxID=2303528 RepID=UPI00196561D4|nr:MULTISPECIES: CU044_2847 family protein [Thermoleptolyngbya]
MPKLQPIQLEDGSILYVEATDDIQAIDSPTNGGGTGNGYPNEPSEEVSRTSKGWNRGNPNTQIAQSFQAIESTIKTYTQHTLNAFRGAAMADVKKVTLEFGVNVSGVGGVPYIATGTAGCNIKIVVECAFPERTTPEPQTQASQLPREIPPSARMSPAREANGVGNGASPSHAGRPTPPPRPIS